MTERETRHLQEALNRFDRKHHALDLSRVQVDGKMGPATRKRVKELKWLLGYGRKKINGKVTSDFLEQLAHPRRNVLRNEWGKKRARRGIRRRAARRKYVAREKVASFFTPGVGTFDGKPCAKWIIPKLKWAREHGWRGALVSGWRSIPYSISLCRNMCGAPTCPGRCAGAGTNHVHHDPLPPPVNGAVDVSDYFTFGQLMARSDCPGPRIFNALGARDPVHFSPSGR